MSAHRRRRGVPPTKCSTVLQPAFMPEDAPRGEGGGVLSSESIAAKHTSVASSANRSRSRFVLSWTRDIHVRCVSGSSACRDTRGRDLSPCPSGAAESAPGPPTGDTGAAAGVGEAGTTNVAPSPCETTCHCAWGSAESPPGCASGSTIRSGWSALPCLLLARESEPMLNGRCIRQRAPASDAPLLG